ncbi:hypothetical protein [Streptomyces virginiae]|uniref:hypothetical protein n=1 Tax=Streptomyces virginiae TaxID=1961 RepID=UPI003F5419C8
MGRFEKLVKVVRERGSNGPGGGRPWCLPLTDQVLLVEVYYRTTLGARQLAPLFGIFAGHPALRPLLALGPAPRPVAGVERLWTVDGTLIPGTRPHRRGALPDYRFSANMPVNIDTRLLMASARPAPGIKTDAHVWRESDLSAAAAGTTDIADRA